MRIGVSSGTVNSEQLAEVAAMIGRAHRLAERGLLDAAVWEFAAAREMTLSIDDGVASATRVNARERRARKEREKYRALIASQRQSADQITVFGDSLGLPRSDATDGALEGADGTYPFMLLHHRPQSSIDSVCQRYFTTRHVLDMLLEEPELCAGADVIMHVGLNDAALRMFLEPERLALDDLPDDVKGEIVDFAQKYRRTILRILPHRHYVPPAEFERNVNTILELLRRRARKVVVATIVLPPIRLWPGTPGIQANRARYNLVLMDAAHRHGATLFDFDRFVWANEHRGALLGDGMHLSTLGHEIFAEQAAVLLTR